MPTVHVPLKIQVNLVMYDFKMFMACRLRILVVG
jgi:hypothetical protein